MTSGNKRETDQSLSCLCKSQSLDSYIIMYSKYIAYYRYKAPHLLYIEMNDFNDININSYLTIHVYVYCILQMSVFCLCTIS